MKNSEIAELWFEKANMHALSCFYSEAIICYEKAINLDSTVYKYFYNYAHTLKKLNRFEDAIRIYKIAIDLDPSNPATFNNIGNIFRDMRRFLDAIDMYNFAIEISPEYYLSYNNLGNALQDVGESQKAIQAYIRSIKLNDIYADPLFNLANLLSEKLLIKESLNFYNKTFQLNNNFPFCLGEVLFNKAKLCDWSGYDQLVSDIMKGIKNGKAVAYPFSIQSFIDNPSIMRDCALIFQNQLQLTDDIKLKILPYKNHKKLKIGYFSSDLFGHNVSRLLEGILENHNHQLVEIVAFTFSKLKTTTSTRNMFDKLIDASSLSDNELVKLARSMEIDVAIDLNGLTKNCRPSIFKSRVAPLQVNFLGYCGTTACQNVDLIVADESLVPRNMQNFYSEKIIYLNNGCFPLKKISLMDDVSKDRKNHGLPDEGLIFACFNNNYKITPQIFKVWISLLSNVEDSILWILAESKEMITNLKAIFESYGGDNSRLIFAPIVTQDAHLQRMQIIDVYLDTYPCSAHTTARDIIQLGKPIVTMSGEAFHSNVTTSLLRTLGIPELIAYNLENYRIIAQLLGKDDLFRDRISAKIHFAFDQKVEINPKIFTHHFEQSLLKAYSAL